MADAVVLRKCAWFFLFLSLFAFLRRLFRFLGFFPLPASTLAWIFCNHDETDVVDPWLLVDELTSLFDSAVLFAAVAVVLAYTYQDGLRDALRDYLPQRTMA